MNTILIDMYRAFLLVLLPQVAWYGHSKVIDADGGPINQSPSSDGTQLMDAVSDGDPSSDDELFGLLENTNAPGATGRKVTNGNYSVSGGVTRGVQQYTENMSSMLTGIDMNQSTVVQ